MKQTKLNFWFHEISWKGLYILFSTIFCFGTCFFYADVFLCEYLQIFLYVMPKNALKFTTFFVTETLSSMLILSLYTTFLCIFPFILYCLHTFYRPSYFLYEAHKQLIFLILSFSFSIAAHFELSWSAGDRTWSRRGRCCPTQTATGKAAATQRPGQWHVC